MAVNSFSDNSMGEFAFMVGFGMLLSLWPLAILTNFRGYRDDHARRIARSRELVRGRRSQSSLLASNSADRTFTTIMQFVVAAGFLMLAMVLVAAGAVGVFGRLSAG